MAKTASKLVPVSLKTLQDSITKVEERIFMEQYVTKGITMYQFELVNAVMESILKPHLSAELQAQLDLNPQQPVQSLYEQLLDMEVDVIAPEEKKQEVSSVAVAMSSASTSPTVKVNKKSGRRRRSGGLNCPQCGSSEEVTLRSKQTRRGDEAEKTWATCKTCQKSWSC